MKYAFSETALSGESMCTYLNLIFDVKTGIKISMNSEYIDSTINLFFVYLQPQRSTKVLVAVLKGSLKILYQGGILSPLCQPAQMMRLFANILSIGKRTFIL